MNGREAGFWISVGLVAVASVAIFKVLGAQRWAPEGIRRLAGWI